MVQPAAQSLRCCFASLTDFGDTCVSNVAARKMMTNDAKTRSYCVKGSATMDFDNINAASE